MIERRQGHARRGPRLGDPPDREQPVLVRRPQRAAGLRGVRDEGTGAVRPAADAAAALPADAGAPSRLHRPHRDVSATDLAQVCERLGIEPPPQEPRRNADPGAERRATATSTPRRCGTGWPSCSSRTCASSGTSSDDLPLVMGVVNVTPDSFSDGGLYADAASAIAHGQQLLADGADILDVGGESTRPGATRPLVEEELDRVVPVITALAEAGATVSVDTMRHRGRRGGARRRREHRQRRLRRPGRPGDPAGGRRRRRRRTSRCTGARTPTT